VGTVPVAAITNLPAGALGNINDFDHGFRELIAGALLTQSGQVFRAQFTTCAGAQPPTPFDFTCTVLSAEDTNADEVQGVTCAVSVLR
jgi:hypothetical protein